MAFSYGTSNNSGNLITQTIIMPKEGIGSLKLSQTYDYDGVNRLYAVNESVIEGATGGGWSRGYGYDAYGNMWAISSAGLTLHMARPTAQDQFDATTNRLTKAFNGATLTNPYDAAGNLRAKKWGTVTSAGTDQRVPPASSRARLTVPHFFAPLALGSVTACDAENRQTQFTGGSTVNYSYDGDGRRVKRVEGSETTVFVYNAFGQLAAEYFSADPTVTGGRFYRTTDHLGSTRLVTDSVGAVVSRHDYTPFGENLDAASSAGNRNLVLGFGATGPLSQKFTGKERDEESGLDYFGARYLSASLGRFTSPDAPFADQIPADPQSWNLYGYVRNKPLRFIDPDGRTCVWVDGEWKDDNSGGQSCADVAVENTKVEPSVTVFDEAPPSPLLQAVAKGAQAASPVTDPRSSPASTALRRSVAVLTHSVRPVRRFGRFNYSQPAI